MENASIEYTDKRRWFALTKINTLSALSQIVQIGSVTPLSRFRWSNKASSRQRSG